jgi:hypothetical protein
MKKVVRLTRGVSVVLLAAVLAATGISAQGQPARPPESFLTKLLRISGLTAAPSQMRGPADEVLTGNVWVAGADGRAPRALTSDGGYRSPIFEPDGTAVLALRAGSIVRTSLQGRSAVVVRNIPGVIKLVGMDATAPGEVVVLVDASAAAPVATVSLQSGAVTPIPFDASSEPQRRMLAQVRAQERTYGGTSVYTRTETKPGLARAVEWIDVFISSSGAPPRNVSNCDGDSCVQPALSPDGRTVAFIRSQE